jgi:hypothetical protein
MRKTQGPILFASILCFVGGIFSCHRNETLENAVIKILPDQPLEAEFGKEIKWGFRAEINGRPIRIVDITSSRLPFGVGLTKENGNLVVAGKVEGRQFRSGIITAVAFDEKGCRESMKLIAEVAGKNGTGDAKQKDLAIPYRECDPDKFKGMPQGIENFYQGKFTWQLVDGIDRMNPGEYSDYFKSFICFDRPDCSRGMFSSLDLMVPSAGKRSLKNIPPDETMFQLFIPAGEAPSKGLMILGNCAQYERKYCGKDNSCLWTGSVCVSSKTTGLSARAQGVK